MTRRLRKLLYAATLAASVFIPAAFSMGATTYISYTVGTYTWTAATSFRGQCWGAGKGGAISTNAESGGGGGGYAEKTAASAGTYVIVVGAGNGPGTTAAGDTWITYVADGDPFDDAYAYAQGGQNTGGGAGVIGDVLHTGGGRGVGGTGGGNTTGGGGGGSAMASADGTAGASGLTGGAGGSGQGAGGNGGTSGNSGQNGTFPGGGAGGGGASGGNAGTGANGLVIISYDYTAAGAATGSIFGLRGIFGGSLIRP